MKKFISKVKKATKDFFTNKSAFSLVELIVVIAIMAVMAAVLAPALLGYVERSRAQKDYSAMGEVSNSVQLSLADSSVYDELLVCSEKDNYSCYADGDTTTNIDANKTVTKSPDLWLYNDNARKLDETAYKPSGKMRGVTITLRPNGKSEYILKNGIVNKIGDDTTKKGSEGGKLLSEAQFSNVYNRLRSTIGDTVKVSSQTYRNSDYTIFISMGTTGGNQADKQDAIKVYGQYNGTNLPEVAAPVAGAGQGAPAGGSGGSGQPGGEGGVPTPDPVVELKRNGIIPDGATYTPNGGTAITGNGTNTFPDTPATGDTYEEGYYMYTYNRGNYYGSEWSVEIKDKNKTEYGNIISEIARKSITNMTYTFSGCKSLTTAPIIPNSVSNMYGTFWGCTSLTTAPAIPNSVTSMDSTFDSCTSLTTAPEIPNSVTDMYAAFSGCTSLTTAPAIPNSVTDMRDTFSFCRSLTTVPAIPNSVTSMDKTFNGCTSLTTPPDMSNATSVTDMESAFLNCTSLTTAPAIPSSVTNMDNTFSGCTSLTTAPAIPSSVTYMRGTFVDCTFLTGTIEVNANPTFYNYCLSGTQITNITGSCSQAIKDALIATK